MEVANISSRVPRVYLDVDLDGASLGRIGIELDAERPREIEGDQISSIGLFPSLYELTASLSIS